ncbi:MAG: calcium-binding protein, partial [Pseudomonadota bacterium]
ADQFVFAGAGFGHDQILDFESGDKIDLSAFSGLSFALLQITDTGNGAQIQIGPDRIDVSDLSASSLLASDFLFA